jgi:hypothetical protein
LIIERICTNVSHKTIQIPRDQRLVVDLVSIDCTFAIEAIAAVKEMRSRWFSQWIARTADANELSLSCLSLRSGCGVEMAHSTGSGFKQNHAEAQFEGWNVSRSAVRTTAEAQLVKVMFRSIPVCSCCKLTFDCREADTRGSNL